MPRARPAPTPTCEVSVVGIDELEGSDIASLAVLTEHCTKLDPANHNGNQKKIVDMTRWAWKDTILPPYPDLVFIPSHKTQPLRGKTRVAIGLAIRLTQTNGRSPGTCPRDLLADNYRRSSPWCST